jgi:hypothetical protein
LLPPYLGFTRRPACVEYEERILCTDFDHWVGITGVVREEVVEPHITGRVEVDL